jgi:hypothetical protein
MLSNRSGKKQKAVFYQRSDLVDNERALLEVCVAYLVRIVCGRALQVGR